MKEGRRERGFYGGKYDLKKEIVCFEEIEQKDYLKMNML